MTPNNLQLMPNGGYKEKPIGNLNSQYKGGLVTNYVWMKDKCDKGLSLSDIAQLSGRSKRTVVRWLKTHNLKTQRIRKFKYGKEHHNYNGSRVCVCGSKKSSNSKRCIKCRNEYQKGINNPNYKGVDDLVTIIRSRVIPDWRKKIFERDSYTCKKCGDGRGGNLEAHHIKTFSTLINEISKTVNLDFHDLIEYLSSHEEILDINNGITLCSACHKKLHKGKRKKIYEVC